MPPCIRVRGESRRVGLVWAACRHRTADGDAVLCSPYPSQSVDARIWCHVSNPQSCDQALIPFLIASHGVRDSASFTLSPVLLCSVTCVPIGEAWAPGVHKLELRDPARGLLGTVYMDMEHRRGGGGGCAGVPGSREGGTIGKGEHREMTWGCVVSVRKCIAVLASMSFCGPPSTPRTCDCNSLCTPPRQAPSGPQAAEIRRRRALHAALRS